MSHVQPRPKLSKIAKMLFSRFLSTLESHSDENCTLKFLRIRMLVKPFHNNTLEKKIMTIKYLMRAQCSFKVCTCAT